VIADRRCKRIEHGVVARDGEGVTGQTEDPAGTARSNRVRGASDRNHPRGAAEGLLLGPLQPHAEMLGESHHIAGRVAEGRERQPVDFALRDARPIEACSCRCPEVPEEVVGPVFLVGTGTVGDDNRLGHLSRSAGVTGASADGVAGVGRLADCRVPPGSAFGSQRIPDSLPSNCLPSQPCDVNRGLDHRARSPLHRHREDDAVVSYSGPAGPASLSRSTIEGIEPATNPHLVTLERATNRDSSRPSGPRAPMAT
jgi:hypothetical protein